MCSVLMCFPNCKFVHVAKERSFWDAVMSYIFECVSIMYVTHSYTRLTLCYFFCSASISVLVSKIIGCRYGLCANIHFAFRIKHVLEKCVECSAGEDSVYGLTVIRPSTGPYFQSPRASFTLHRLQLAHRLKVVDTPVPPSSLCPSAIDASLPQSLFSSHLLHFRRSRYLLHHCLHT